MKALARLLDISTGMSPLQESEIKCIQTSAFTFSLTSVPLRLPCLSQRNCQLPGLHSCFLLFTPCPLRCHQDFHTSYIYHTLPWRKINQKREVGRARKRVGQWGISRSDGSRGLQCAWVMGLTLQCLGHQQKQSILWGAVIAPWCSQDAGTGLSPTHGEETRPTKPTSWSSEVELSWAEPSWAWHESANLYWFAHWVKEINDYGFKPLGFQTVCYRVIANWYSTSVWYLITSSWLYSVFCSLVWSLQVEEHMLQGLTQVGPSLPLTCHLHHPLLSSSHKSLLVFLQKS